MATASTTFPPDAASDYDVRIPRLVPGYGLAGELATAILTRLLPDGARILVAGCGTGSELARLAAANASWRFVGLDPSPAMLARAQARLAASKDEARVQWVAAPLGASDLPPCDAALAFLVDHFIPDDGARAGFLAALAAPLRPGASALLFHHAGGRWDGAYGQWLRMQDGADDPDAVIARIAAKWHPLAPDRRRVLLAEAGFGAPHVFFSALAYEGIITVRG